MLSWFKKLAQLIKFNYKNRLHWTKVEDSGSLSGRCGDVLVKRCESVCMNHRQCCQATLRQ